MAQNIELVLVKSEVHQLNISKHEIAKSESLQYTTQASLQDNVDSKQSDDQPTQSDGRIICQICQATFKNTSNLKQHLKYKHPSDEDVKECNECFRTFKSAAHLRSHIKSVHYKGELVSCPHCNKTFDNHKKLKNHIFYSHPDPNEAVQCTMCSKSFKRNYNLKIHIRNVHPSEEMSVTCNYCEKVFKNDMLLQRHIKWRHPIDGMEYKCYECGRILQSIICYRKHMQNVHSDTEIMCYTCDKVFKTPKSLKRHEIVHENELKSKYPRQISCLLCDKKFIRAAALLWHMDKFHDSRSNTCELCSKKFPDQSNLKRHIEVVHSLNFSTCNICSKTFKSRLSLQRHLRITHAPPEAAEGCTVCGRVFKCRLHLKIHMNTVHKEAECHTCEICDKQFVLRKYLDKHKLSHIVTRDFACEVCSKTFRCAYDVRKHFKRVHCKDSQGNELQDPFVNTYNNTIDMNQIDLPDDFDNPTIV